MIFFVNRKVGLEDEGPYTCRASNEGGFTEKKAFVRVQGQCCRSEVKLMLSVLEHLVLYDRYFRTSYKKYSSQTLFA